MPSEIRRKLTTILAADAEGYSRSMARDEVGTLAALRLARGVFARLIAHHHGRIANTAGDGLIAEFPSVVEAVQCAIEVQQDLGDRRGPSRSALRFRIGIHLGDVIVEGDDLPGDGVNLAARLQSMADAGGILISQQVYDQVHAKLSVGFDYLGRRRPKNFAEDVPVYCVTLATGAPGLFGWRKVVMGLQSRQPSPNGIQADTELRESLRYRAKRAGVFLGALLAINLVTGMPLWVVYPAIILATLLLLQAAPLFARGRFGAWPVRTIVLIGGFVALNIASWDGYPWSMWPSGGLILIHALRRLSDRSH